MLRDTVRLRRKVKFFGSELVLGEAQLAYPDFEMCDEAAETLADMNKQLLYKKPFSRVANKVTHRVDLPRVVAANDIRALLYVAPVVSVSPERGTVMHLDRSLLDDSDSSFISFGLSSNDLTHLYLEVDEDPLFRIVEDGKGSEYITVDDEPYQSTDDVQYGVILRYHPREDNPTRCWFIIAGLGPLGTTAAAYYLAENWDKLADRTMPEGDFVAIVSTNTASEKHARLVKLKERK